MRREFVANTTPIPTRLASYHAIRSQGTQLNLRSTLAGENAKIQSYSQAFLYVNQTQKLVKDTVTTYTKTNTYTYSEFPAHFLLSFFSYSSSSSSFSLSSSSSARFFLFLTFSLIRASYSASPKSSLLSCYVGGEGCEQ